jgi:hypothetical protein
MKNSGSGFAWIRAHLSSSFRIFSSYCTVLEHAGLMLLIQFINSLFRQIVYLGDLHVAHIPLLLNIEQSHGIAVGKKQKRLFGNCEDYSCKYLPPPPLTWRLAIVSLCQHCQSLLGGEWFKAETDFFTTSTKTTIQPQNLQAFRKRWL